MREVAARAAQLQDTLLAWYDLHARQMPWRVGPAARAAGVRPDPYRVWLSEVMLQQTTVAAVRGPYLRFLARWPDVRALAAAEDGAVMGEWAGLGYYARARNLLACARAVVDRHGGRFPDSAAGLRTLPGVGPYTAAAVAAIAFDEPAAVVDGNVERVMARMAAVQTPLPDAKPELAALAAGLTPQRRAGDYAQAVMDLGATICTPRNPACALCPWRAACRGHALGSPADLPRRRAKPPKPTRSGSLWVIERADGAVLLERRPPRGLLGGMLVWPSAGWLPPAGGDAPRPAETAPPPVPPFASPPAPLDYAQAGAIRHTFTHFHLELRVFCAIAPPDLVPARGSFVPRAAFQPSDLPSVMRKAWDSADAALDQTRQLYSTS